MKTEDERYYQMVINTCLLAGKIMIESGSDMQRVNDIIYRIAQNAGLRNVNAYITVTAIVMSANPDIAGQVIDIKKRSFNLTKIAKVNELSRQFASGQITIPTFFEELKIIEVQNDFFPLWLQIVGAILVSGPLVVVFRNNWVDFLPSCLVAALAWILFYFLNRYVNIRFLSEFAAAFMIAGLAALTVNIGWGHNMDDIIIGSLMPLVPGIPLTNAVRDLLAGNLVSGPARGIEALISASALGFGVAVGLHFF
ncbi:threonine/serine exporter family protein [Lentilactobacillus senioris]|uniref:threonine/serine exporter family protein n=1 Tax=Lentilactobacillus senioris TaxID=931534 RepID=UPI0022816E31|nr:threonine/serine exporter family protein [Lentilactobacillus senioris]MCY9806606.1 threonine/serine exporter family protein [Lentilactobacillus senioris]